MLAEWDSQRLFQHVAGEHYARAGFGEAAGDHGAAFPDRSVAAPPVDGKKLSQFRWPALCEIAEQCSPKTSQSR